TKQDRTDIIVSLLKFGEEGFKLWERICDQHPQSKEQVKEKWEELEKAGKAEKTPSKFFAMCKHHEITMAAIKKKYARADYGVELPDGVDHEDYFRYGFYIKDGSYYSIGKDGERCVAEFTIRVLYLIKSKSQPKRIVELKNKYGYSEILDMPTDCFSSLGTFKKAIESVGPYVFEGNDTDLTRL